MSAPSIQIRNAQYRAGGVAIQAVVVPVVAALIGAGATVAVPIIGPSVSPSSSTSSSGSTIVVSPNECANYEEGFLVPLARINYKLIAPFLNSHSPINYICGLIPSPSPFASLLPSPSPIAVSPSIP
jgi:hypothetical protein